MRIVPFPIECEINTPGPVEMLLEDENRRQVSQFLEGLEPGLRTIVSLRFGFHGPAHSVAAIASELGASNARIRRSLEAAFAMGRKWGLRVSGCD
jgi:DNA-directed RNA polymerase sigma subunit (sigma70/sigma32)